MCYTPRELTHVGSYLQKFISGIENHICYCFLLLSAIEKSIPLLLLAFVSCCRINGLHVYELMACFYNFYQFILALSLYEFNAQMKEEIRELIDGQMT
jgi:hypothetical protein